VIFLFLPFYVSSHWYDFHQFLQSIVPKVITSRPVFRSETLGLCLRKPWSFALVESRYTQATGADHRWTDKVVSIINSELVSLLFFFFFQCRM
jgi:hypothetical protein